jgi:hypothetical protein
MDTSAADIADQTLAGLRRHWIALAGVGVAAVMGGGFGKALVPQDLHNTPVEMQMISGPPVQLAEHEVQRWSNGRVPDYVIGADMARPPRDYDAAAYTEAFQPVAETSFDADRYARPEYQAIAASVTEHAREAAQGEPWAPPHNLEAQNAYTAASDDAFSALPAMAPG